MPDKIDRKVQQAALAALFQNYGVQTSHRSLVYAKAVPRNVAEPDPACATCPAGMWLVTDGVLCFCKVLKQWTWGLDRSPVLVCDERERLLNDLGDHVC